jgi:N-acyl amino acid synthase of PEP-CTERM/exosortase system
MIKNILDGFNEYFEMVPAVSPQLKHEVYKLRYQVYCIETGFEKPENHPNFMESDEYDDNSVHYLIRHRKSEIYAATTRLILPDATNREKLFPIEKYTQIDKKELLENIPLNKLAEASRFCVSKEFKRRKNEAGTLTGIGSAWEADFTEDERRVFPHLSIALFACLIKMSDDFGIHYWYAVMEPALIRFFTTLGIYFIGIGPLTEYHGMRQPCMIKVSDLLDGVVKKNHNLWEMMTNKGQIGLNTR